MNHDAVIRDQGVLIYVAVDVTTRHEVANLVVRARGELPLALTVKAWHLDTCKADHNQIQSCEHQVMGAHTKSGRGL